MSTFRLNGCYLTVVGRCPRCQTWARDHTDEECARWRALRSDPSHVHAAFLDPALRTLGRLDETPRETHG